MSISRRRQRKIPYQYKNDVVGVLGYIDLNTGSDNIYATFKRGGAVPKWYWDRGQRYESCVDELHEPPFHEGGPFDLWRRESLGLRMRGVIRKERYVPHNYYPRIWYYTGSFVSGYRIGTKQMGSSWVEGKPTWESPNQYGTVDMSEYDPEMIKLFRIKPTANMGQFIAEFREIPQMLYRRARAFYRSWQRFLSRKPGRVSARRYANAVSGAWLEHNFGWVPFVKDVQDFIHTWQYHSKVLRDLKKWNGKFRTRRRILTNSRVIETLAGHTSATMHYPPALVNLTDVVPGSYHFTRVNIEHAWVEGSFRYYIPDVGSINWDRRAIRYLMGFNVTPQLIWQLTPWSWLVDWYSKIGDMFDTAPDLQENLCARYTYTMRTRKTVLACNSSMNFKDGSKDYRTWYYTLVRKVRYRGMRHFETEGQDLTLRQKTILGALGIQRLT